MEQADQEPDREPERPPAPRRGAPDGPLAGRETGATRAAKVEPATGERADGQGDAAGGGRVAARGQPSPSARERRAGGGAAGVSAHDRLNLSAARASVAVAVTLVTLKLWAALTTGALSVLASLVDSGMDLVMSLGAMLALRYAARPPDDDHAFGHTSVEDLAALGQAVVLCGAAVLIGTSAVARLWAGEAPGMASEAAGAAVMAVSVLLTLALVVWQGRVVRITGSRVVAADRLHYMSDLLPAGGAVLALAISARWGFWQADSVVGLLTAAVLLRGALGIGGGAWDALMDRRADPAILDGIAAIASGWPGVRGWHDLKTRTAGSRIFVHLHIELDGSQTLAEAHEIGAGLRRAILAAYPQADVIIHKDVYRHGAEDPDG